MDFLGEAVIAQHEIAARGLVNLVDQVRFNVLTEYLAVV